MERKQITCPESARREDIEFERTPYGLVIAGCSRFEPHDAVTCSRECARRLDSSDRSDDSRDRVLVVFARAAWTRPVAAAAAELLVRDGLEVEVVDADAVTPPPPADYDAVVIGSPQHLGRRARSILDYASKYRDALGAMPAFWFGVGRSDVAIPGRMRRATGWLPARSFAIVRPRWWVRWFGNPDHERAPHVYQLARAVGDETPAHELDAAVP